MKFTKMQGCGNDYIYVNCFEEQVEYAGETAKRLSHRHFGIGGDGLILIGPSRTADFLMTMYNADGSLGAMCGNGIRCLGKYVYDKGLTDKTELLVETKAGVKRLKLKLSKGKVKTVGVDMGVPKLLAREIPAEAVPGISIDPEKRIQELPLEILGNTYQVTCVSMGNPHAVVFLTPGEQQAEALNLWTLGPAFESHPMFPDRVNVEFAQVLDQGHIKMRVWERGTGETFACGTGACAAAVAGSLTGRTADSVVVETTGGSLLVWLEGEAPRVWMEGPAVTVFEGEV
ncbi:MAG: diaminopimelate epimerase [Lachnospiraceae bacterium]|jgi:diaminopimelate epimerase|nr:diaminopimelate epimerase [Lachnospiraceae bacterium]